jgi:hypothetical protein
MTVELGSFWRKPTEVGERFEELPRILWAILMCKRVRKGESKQFWLVLEEEDQRVRGRLGG